MNGISVLGKENETLVNSKGNFPAHLTTSFPGIVLRSSFAESILVAFNITLGIFTLRAVDCDLMSSPPTLLFHLREQDLVLQRPDYMMKYQCGPPGEYDCIPQSKSYL